MGWFMCGFPSQRRSGKPRNAKHALCFFFSNLAFLDSSYLVLHIFITNARKLAYLLPRNSRYETALPFLAIIGSSPVWSGDHCFNLVICSSMYSYYSCRKVHDWDNNFHHWIDSIVLMNRDVGIDGDGTVASLPNMQGSKYVAIWQSQSL